MKGCVLYCVLLLMTNTDKLLTATLALKCQSSHIFSSFCFVLSTESHDRNATIFKDNIQTKDWINIICANCLWLLHVILPESLKSFTTCIIPHCINLLSLKLELLLIKGTIKLLPPWGTERNYEVIDRLYRRCLPFTNHSKRIIGNLQPLDHAGCPFHRSGQFLAS